jgi:microcystin-dependent protein
MAIFDYPVGSVTPFAGGAIPVGWCACDGASYDGTLDDYKDLWTLIGTTYGGTGQSSFKVPNLGSRVPVGVKTVTSSTGLDGPIGSWTGNTTATLTDSSYCGVQSHYHTLNDPGHDHVFSHSFSTHTHTFYFGGYTYGTKATGNNGTFVAQCYNGGSGSNPGSLQANSCGVTYGSATLSSASITNNTAVSPASAHENRQPQLATNYIIKL